MTDILTAGTTLVTITPANPIVRYSVDCTTPVKIYTTGSYDTYCTVRDSNLNIITNFDDIGGGNYNFSFAVPSQLPLGNYYLDISLYAHRAVDAQFNLIVEYVIPPLVRIEHTLLCALLPDNSTALIEQKLSCPLLSDVTLFSHELPCPIFTVSYIEQSLLCPFFGTAFVEHALKINSVFYCSHDLAIVQWTTSYAEHSLIVLMISHSMTEHQLLCPLSSINQAIQQTYLLSVPMLMTDSVVIDAHDF